MSTKNTVRNIFDPSKIFQKYLAAYQNGKKNLGHLKGQCSNSDISLVFSFAITNWNCVKSVRIRSYSGPNFAAFGLNTERYGVSLSIRTECGKMRTRITSNTDKFSRSVMLKFLKLLWQIILKTLLQNQFLGQLPLPPHKKDSIRNTHMKRKYFTFLYYKIQVSHQKYKEKGATMTSK